MVSIYKYDVNVGDNVLWLPEDAKFLAIGEQDDELKVWALLDPLARKVARTVGVVPTGDLGDSIKPDWQFIGTAVVSGGRFVWHAFLKPVKQTSQN